MKVLGFDVGIKNLAFCVVEKQDEYYNIPEPVNKFWNIINLTEQCDLHCAKEGCDNPVTQIGTIEGTKHYYCGRHKSLHKALLLENPIYIDETDDTTARCDCTASCKTKSKWMNYDNYLCTKHKTLYEKNITKERILKKYKTFVKDFTIHDLKLILLNKLDEMQDIFLTVDCVCIENQPVFRNPTMKAISDVMYTWFMIRGFIDKDITNSSINKICFFAPSNKMKINDKEKELNEEIDNAKNKYKKTKNLAIEHCSSMICHNEDYVGHLDKYKKKDDLCDAYLHAVYYIQKEGKKKVKKTSMIV
jgi:hypothetical protein